MITHYFHNYETHEIRQICIDYYRNVVTKVVINIPTCSYKIHVFFDINQT
jgi:hypothetical protein